MSLICSNGAHGHGPAGDLAPQHQGPLAELLLDREIAITRLRGTWQDYRGIPLMPTLHPAFVLRQYTPENRRAVWQDLKAAWEQVQS